MTLMRSKRLMTYHNRSGYPVIHVSHYRYGTDFIMVRRKGGGTKRLYLTPKALKKLLSKKGVRR